MNNAQGIPMNCGTFVGSGVPVYNFTKPVFGGDYIRLIAQPTTRTISPAFSGIVTTKDVQNIVTSGVSTITDYIVSINQLVSGDYPTTIISNNSGIILGPNNSGVASGISSGTTTLFASVTTDSSIFSSASITVTQVTGSSSSTFNSYVSGSLSRSIGDAVDTRIAGKTASVAKPMFTTQNHASGIYVRNTNCWVNGLDLTCISPWNSTHGKNAAGTLISPRHVLFAAHYNYYAAAGATIHFVTLDNTLVTRTISATQRHPNFVYPVTGPDIVIGVLDSDVPNTISFAKVLPTTWKTYLPTINTFISGATRVPVFATDQAENALIINISSLPEGTNYGFWLTTPVNTSPRYAFNESFVVGDSGSPVFLIINGELVLVGTITWGGAGGGTAVYSAKDAVNTMMANLGGGYSLTEVDLSGFSSY